LVVFDQFAQSPYGLQVSAEADGWRTHYVRNDAQMAMQAPSENPSIRVESAAAGVEKRAVKATWFRPARLTLASRPRATLTNYANGSLVLDLTVHGAPNAPVRVEMDCGDACRAEIDVTRTLSLDVGTPRTLNIPLACFAAKGANLRRVVVPFALFTSEAFAVSIARVRVVDGAAADANALRCDARSSTVATIR